jgi:hypothetical protein
MPRSHDLIDDTAAWLPPDLQAEIDMAWERAQDLLGGELELRFESEPALGRAWGALALPGGEVLEHISASEALALCCGDAVAVPVLAAV